jgi:hypothetical protein
MGGAEWGVCWIFRHSTAHFIVVGRVTDIWYPTVTQLTSGLHSVGVVVPEKATGKSVYLFSFLFGLPHPQTLFLADHHMALT